MGVRGLETFLHSHPECCVPVNIEKLAKEYRSIHNTKPKLMIDIIPCLTFFNNKKPWVSGSQIKELANKIENLLTKLQSIDIEVAAYIDGHIDPIKVNSWFKKRKDQLNTANKIFKSLMYDQQAIIEQDYFEMYPINIQTVVIETFKKLNCQIFQSVIPCDLETAIYTKKNNFFGLLGQDSDFVIYNCAEHYFSMKSLDLETLNTIDYRSDKFAAILELSPEQLPIFATAMGNGTVDSQLLMSFHRNLFRGQRFSKVATFSKVAQFIKKNVKNGSLDSQLPGLANLLLGNSKKSFLLEKSLSLYDMFYPHEEKALIYSDNDKWAEIQRKTLELHKESKLPCMVFSVVFHSVYYHRVHLENPNHKKYQILFEMGKNIRKVIYGILLMSKPEDRKPNSVKELYIDSNMEKQESHVTPTYPKMKVDLIELWSTNDEEEKWKLFCSSLDIKQDMLPIEDRHLIIPVAALKYLMMQHFDIDVWELEAVVASMLLIRYYSIKDLESISESPLDPNGIHLYWFLIRIFDLVATLNSVCGYPLDSELTNPVNFQDGKLFHQKYREAKDNMDFDKLCEFRQKEITTGKKIMAMILE